MTEDFFIEVHDPGVGADDSPFCESYTVHGNPTGWYAAFENEPGVWMDTQGFVNDGRSVGLVRSIRSNVAIQCIRGRVSQRRRW